MITHPIAIVLRPGILDDLRVSNGYSDELQVRFKKLKNF